MLEKFKNIHYMFHISLVFIIFPIAGVIVGDYPAPALLWTPTICNCLLFGFVRSRTVQCLAWWSMLVPYILYIQLAKLQVSHG